MKTQPKPRPRKSITLTKEELAQRRQEIAKADKEHAERELAKYWAAQ